MTTRGMLVAALLVCGCATNEERLQKTLDQLAEQAAAKNQPIAPDELRLMKEKPNLKCASEVQSYNHLICCDGVGEVQKPTTIAEVQALVKRAADEKKHLRVLGHMHTSNQILCTDGIAMSLENLSSFFRMRHGKHGRLAVADAGMTLRDFDQKLYDEGWSIGFGVIGFRGVTLGGAVATGAHGSSPVENAVISERVEMIELVQADAQLHTYWRDSTPPDQFKAMTASLGLLGVVVRLGFKVERRFELAVKTSTDEEKVLFQKGVQPLLAGCDFGQVVWYPRANRIMRICGTRTLDEPQPGASSVLLMPKASESAVSTFRGIMESTIRTGAPLCSVEEDRFLAMKHDPPYVHDCCCKRESATEVTGPSHMMLSSELTPFHDELPEIDFEIAVPLSHAQQALELVNQFVDGKNMCLPMIGVFLRFSARDDSTLIGHTSMVGEPVMFLELVAYVSKDEQRTVGPGDPYYAPYWELARMLIRAPFDGRPHWGKNATDLFQIAGESEAVKDRLKRFRAVRRELDPDGVFVNAFARDVGLVDEK